MKAFLAGSGSGVSRLVFSGLKPGALPTIDQPKAEATPPLIKGTPDDFAQKYGKEALKQIKNKVLKCPSCGKANAFTLKTCNSCGTSLEDVKISYPNNVFAGFVYGIQKGPFPFTISIRHQCEEFLVFDDLLALSACHVNCIPTNTYVPDIRVLFEKPELGLKLVNEMEDTTWNVVKKQFLSDSKFRNKMLKGGDKIDVDKMRKHIITGFNYPPSQYWLHLQYMLPPLTPFHYSMYQDDRHFTYGRFFPLEYVQAALMLGEIKNASQKPISAIIATCEAKGLRYDDVWHKAYARYGASHLKFANWEASDFTRVIVNGTSVASIEDFKTLEIKPADALKEDKMELQNYGRPYVQGRPKGNYYKYAKKSVLPEF
mmetsp:Transcript_686/g.934  ORF Transcript_686/g.934 Transcript_686/m.934 type:complete len:372 (+) Transcript_686:6-1121(+)